MKILHANAEAVAEKPESIHRQRQGIAAAEELRKTVRAALTAVFGKFIEQLPAALMQTGATPANKAQQRASEELARSVTVSGQLWLQTFVQQVDHYLTGDVASTGNAHATPFSGAEDSITIANMELRAETLHHDVIRALDTALDRVRKTHYLPIYTRALAPAAMCRALQDTADALAWPGTQRRVLFEKFDKIVIAELGLLYRSLLDALTRIQTATPDPEATAEIPLGPVKPRAVQGVPPPDVAPRVDPNTLSMLQAAAAGAAATGYNDGSLALDLLALGQEQPIEGVIPEQRWVPLQRISLAGQLLNEAIADPFVAKELRTTHEAVRFPLVKSALTDSTLFTAVTHPLRSLVNELMLKSATSRITGSAEARRMAELLQQVLVQFDLAPDFVREAMLTAHPIDEAQIQRFFEMQRQQTQERRDTVINEAKRLVVRELELRTFARAIPEPAIRFLNTSWGPLLVKRLLKYGAGHDTWKTGLAAMEQLLDQIEDRDPAEPPPQAWQALTRSMATELAAEGLTPERVAAALALLETARQAR